MISLDKHHVILYAVAIALTLGITYLIESHQVQVAEQRYELLKLRADATHAADYQLQIDVLKEVDALKTQNKELQDQNAQEAKLISSLTAKLQTQQVKDATLPPPELASRIQTLVPVGTVTVVPNGYTLDQVEAVAVTQALEEPPVLRQQLAAAQVIIADDETTITNDVKILDAEKKSHASALDIKSADLAAANQQIVALKANSRKGKLKWFGIGYGVGFGSALILRVMTLK